MARYDEKANFATIKAWLRNDLLGLADEVKDKLVNSSLRQVVNKIRNDYTDSADMANKFGISQAKAQAFFSFVSATQAYVTAINDFKSAF